MTALALHHGWGTTQVHSNSTQQGFQAELLADLNRASTILDDLMRATAITQADLRVLGAAFVAQGGVTRAEADTLFALECAKNQEKCPGWSTFFVEAVVSHVVWETRPTGIINESQGEWLVQWADRAASVNGLAVLVQVLAEAQRVPLWFLAVVKSRAAKDWSGVADAKAKAARADVVRAGVVDAAARQAASLASSVIARVA